MARKSKEAKAIEREKIINAISKMNYEGSWDYFINQYGGIDMLEGTRLYEAAQEYSQAESKFMEAVEDAMIELEISEEECGG